MLISSCSKQTPAINTSPSAPETIPSAITDGFITYILKAGSHYADQNPIKALAISEMNFIVKFDSSAIYQTVSPENQYDINKLYGFSEGYDHHINSARIGWAYHNSALRLYAYVYKNSERLSREISTIPLNTPVKCSITISGNNYFFTVNDAKTTLPRALSTELANGYQLYPYFGGDEVAPHDIRIKIKVL